MIKQYNGLDTSVRFVAMLSTRTLVDYAAIRTWIEASSGWVGPPPKILFPNVPISVLIPLFVDVVRFTNLHIADEEDGTPIVDPIIVMDINNPKLRNSVDTSRRSVATVGDAMISHYARLMAWIETGQGLMPPWKWTGAISAGVSYMLTQWPAPLSIRDTHAASYVIQDRNDAILFWRATWTQADIHYWDNQAE